MLRAMACFSSVESGSWSFPVPSRSVAFPYRRRSSEICAFATTTWMAVSDAASLLPVFVRSAADPAASAAPPTISCRLDMDFPRFFAESTSAPPLLVMANIGICHIPVNEAGTFGCAARKHSRLARAAAGPSAQEAERSYSSMNSPVGPMIWAKPASFGGKNHVPSPLDSTRSAIASRSAFSSRKWFEPR